MTITVYTQPECAGCRWTKKFLAAHNIPFTEIDVSLNDEARHALAQQGFSGLEMPVVKTSYGTWHGYNREKLKDLAAVFEGERRG